MQYPKKKLESDLYQKLKWLIFFRALFAMVLLCSSVIAGYNERLSFLKAPILYLYGISASILILSVIYTVILSRISRLVQFGYIQLTIDSLLVSGIILLTGGFASVFSFLYLVVIIYASMVAFRKGSMFVAIICSIQYGVLVDLEYYSLIIPYGFEAKSLMTAYSWNYVIYKLAITIIACLAIASLSGYLSEQERRAKKDLWAMEEQVKRVEKLAAVGEMASGLAHEIKNPLASISGSIQVLKDDLPYDQTRDRLMEIILRETDRISALLNDFLMFAKPQPGKAKIIELDKAIDDIVRLFQSDGRHNHRTVISKELGNGIYISIDPDQLRQIMWNLLLNAEDAIENNGRIDISLHPANKKSIMIKVTDSGCGMSEETLKYIFDPFFTKKAKGTGLGLSIVQRIIMSYDGIIDVTSSPGNGTSFIITFPRATQPCPVPPQI